MVAYQIYPRSFYDSNDDGVGDLKGIIKKLDYLAGHKNSLGIDVIWLCPFYRSPMKDFGYDISDYYSIDPIFGSMDDFQNLLNEAHKRGIKVLVDLVANHTSDEHAWFIDSKSSNSSEKRDWYIWRKGKNGLPPNDWLSVFGGSAWQYDKKTNEYYLHSFSKHQPDLNWENHEVREAIKDVMRFWLDLGVDGFRADAVYWLAKDHRFRNDPPLESDPLPKNPDYDDLLHTYSQKGPKLYEHLREMTDILKKYKNKFMVVEAYPEGGKEALLYSKFYRYVDPKHLAPINIELIFLQWNSRVLQLFLDDFQSRLRKNDLPIYTLGNHDQKRLASRMSKTNLPLAALLLLTLPGMPFLYYGEELGMEDSEIPNAYRSDPLAKRGFDRDAVRTPMQWNDKNNAGFSDGEPWLPVNRNHQDINVEHELKNKDSLLSLYRRLIDLRKKV